MKKILTISPLQHVEAGTLIYNAVNNEKLHYNVPTCFPVLPLINGYVKSGDAGEVFVITTENHEVALENYLEIERKAVSLCESIGASCSISKINIPFKFCLLTCFSNLTHLIIFCFNIQPLVNF